jgi:NAD(P)-dependent dehydrogenase (short-subunit alcohol dehydrogenase family)
VELSDRVIVITGGGSGIGRAMAERFAAERPRGIVVVDQNGDSARTAADQVGALPVTADLTRESEVLRVITETEKHFGPVDVFCSNAGIVQPVGGLDVPDEGWLKHWNLHVMSHVWAARALVPGMTERGSGYLLNTASAAGLLMLTGAVPYTVSKHAAVALAESLAVLYGGNGVHFSCLCPTMVETPLVKDGAETPVGRALRAPAEAISPAAVAETVVEGLRDERFLILTDPRSAELATLRATDPGGYLKTMAGLWSTVGGRES